MTESNHTHAEPGLELVDESGAWPFLTRRTFRKPDGSLIVWRSRCHRKGLAPRAAGEAERLVAVSRSCLWNPRELNWWIGIVFALGSLLFAVASALSLSPELAREWALDTTEINAIFFVGSIPFTTAAYLQLFQSANAGEFLVADAGAPRQRVIFGWRPRDVGWLTSALQFVGTILFNLNTLDAMIPSLTWFQEDLVIWAPNIIGSILFLASGYLAFTETCHAHWAWKPASISWWVVSTNLLGCVGFMISALFAIVLPGTPNADAATTSIVFTLLGAIGFLVGSLLLLPETISTGEEPCQGLA